MSAIARPGPVYQRVTEKLTAALRPTALTLIDETPLHASHPQSPKRPETHFNLQIVSPVFEGLSLIQRQRKVYAILSEELESQIHALSMKTKAPSELDLTTPKPATEQQPPSAS
eukprot:GFKZ01006303.1.p1 GENE.GFKZ01006303.1~~GFKZ01006303.1.p1  ORF type:complete len:114 (-),score=11.62 GFKZ01006303.1:570-911(-)